MAGRPSGKATFDVLNGLRGVAAITVVNMHMSNYFGVVHPANVAPAVDFFFVLSGFVIAYAYEDKLTSVLLWRDFLKARVIRLYPLYLIGSVFGALVVWFLERPTNPVRFFYTLGLNLFMLPNPVPMDALTTPLFPLNFPAWSLFVELVANLAYAALVPRLWAVRPTRFHLHPALLFVLLPLPLLLKPAGPFGWLYELAVLTLYMPAMVWPGTGSRPGGVWRPASVALGALSYPLYMVHAPVWMAIRTLEGWQPTSVLIGYAPWSGIVMMAGLCAVAWWLDKAVDDPLRRRLYRAIPHRSTHAADPKGADARR